MNTNTGEIYRGKEHVVAAKARGEPLVPLSEELADILEKLPKEDRRRLWREKWLQPKPDDTGGT